MGTTGLALPWRSRIIGASQSWGSRVNPAEHEVSRTSESCTEKGGEEARIVAACQKGELHAYEWIYKSYGLRMKSYARNLLGNSADADDAVQETFVKIHRSVARFRSQSGFVTWIFRILINTCYDLRRSRYRKQEFPQESAEDLPLVEPRAPSAHPCLKMALERALSSLTSHQRDVFLLYEVDGFSHGEIAVILEVSETASKNTLFQAKKKLRQILEAPRSSSAPLR
jgi:RNA polymerase sigma-70 factor, ECF subfamily